VQLGELVARMVPGVERVALFHSGGEAVSAAARMARAATGRLRLAKFEGCNHGANEIGLHNPSVTLGGWPPTEPPDRITPAAATAGVPTRPAAEYLILPFNMPEALELIRRHAAELAGVVVDPVPPFMGNWLDDARRFLTELAATTAACGVPLILDEVMCGFRLARGGAREWAAVRPQASCYGKLTSGLGLPLALVGGDARLLNTASTAGLFRDYAGGKVWVSSTLHGSFLPVVAALAQLRALDEHYDDLTARLDRNHADLRARLQDFARARGIPVSLQGHPRLQVQLSVGKKEPAEKTYRALIQSASMGQFRTLLALTFYLRLHGIYTRLLPTMNLSAAHTAEDVERLAQGIGASLLEMERDGMLPS
jgi:glutamate-1-semialdehyde 2,1-aminomutase